MTTIAIIAFVLAAVAILIASRLGLRVGALEAALTPDEEEEGAEDEAQELWLSDGELYAADKAALDVACPGAVAFCTYEGIPCAVVPGQGVVSLHKLLSERQKPQAVKPHAV